MTADTFSNTIGYLVMGTGNDNNAWGALANSEVFQVFEDAIANVLTNTVTGGTLDLSTSPPPAATSQVHYAALIFNGVLGSAQIIKVPNLTKFWFVQNATSGAFALTIQTPTGAASTAIPQNAGWQLVQCDGANNIIVQPFNSKQVQMPDGSVSAPPYSSINETNSGWRRAGTQDWRLSINGADVVQITAAGAGTPNVFNVLAPLSMQSQGVQLIPPGVEVPFAGINPPTGWYLEFGQAASRTVDANLFAVIAPNQIGGVPITGNTHSSTTIDGLSISLSSIGADGAIVEGLGIQTGTTITGIPTASSITLSLPTTGTASGISIRICPYGQGDGSTTFNLPDRRGRLIAGRDNMGGPLANRITAASGILGYEMSTAGGAETTVIAQANLPNASFAVTIPAGQGGHGHIGTVPFSNSGAGFAGGGLGPAAQPSGSTGVSITPNTLPSMTGTAASGGSGTAFATMPPTAISNHIIKR